jgi:WD40 repeat protein
VNYVAFSPDGTKLATAGDDNCARVWNTATGKLITRLNHSALVAFVAFSPDGKKLATASRDHTFVQGVGSSVIKVWNSSNWDFLFDHTMEGGDINSMRFSPNGTKLAIGGQVGAIEIIDMENGPPRNLQRDNYDIYDMNFNPNGTKLAITGMNRKVWIYDAITWNPDPIMEQKIEGYGKSVAFSPDGSKIIVGCTEKIASILNAYTGKEILNMEHYDEVLSVAFSPDGKRLATGSRDGTARIWTWDRGFVAKDACSKLTHNMTGEEWGRFLENPDSDCLTCPAEGRFNRSSIWPWERWGQRECQPCGGILD